MAVIDVIGFALVDGSNTSTKRVVRPFASADWPYKDSFLIAFYRFPARTPSQCQACGIKVVPNSCLSETLAHTGYWRPRMLQQLPVVSCRLELSCSIFKN